jgi:RNA polymerase sigma-32 factor
MSTATMNLPVLVGESGLAAYLQKIRAFPVLSHEQELSLAKRWRDTQDLKAAHVLVTSHLRLVAKMALKFRGYGLPMADMIAEGNMGLMQAVKKFDPDKGFRLSTYAMWWIKASMQEFVLHSWSMVKIGTTSAQKKLFFNLRRLKGKMLAHDGEENSHDLTMAQAEQIAAHLSVTPREVYEMNGRMAANDHSLNAPISGDVERIEWQDTLVDQTSSPEYALVEADEYDKRKSSLNKAMRLLNEREKEIFTARRLTDPALTLEELSVIHNISRERVRQIENKAFEKVQGAMVVA